MSIIEAGLLLHSAHKFWSHTKRFERGFASQNYLDNIHLVSISLFLFSLSLSVSLSHKSWFFFVFLHMRSFKTKQQQKHEHIFWHIFLVVQEAVVGVNHISNFFGNILNGLESFKSYFFVSQMKLFLKSIFIVVICKAMCELIESIRWFYCHSSCYYCC